MICNLYLKEPNKDGETLIMLSAYFKSEGRRFVYSTGENINPKDWSNETKQIKGLNGRTEKANKLRVVDIQIKRYVSFFTEITNKYIISDQEINIAKIRSEFDKEFKKTRGISNDFFAVYDLFVKMKKVDNSETSNSLSTIKRYEYTKSILEDFEKYKGSKLHFSKIDKKFYADIITFFVEVKKHSNNTQSRNMGLIKAFMGWAYENNYTYKTDFKAFKKITRQITNEVALTMPQVVEIFQFDFSETPKLERVRDLFVFGCVTGMRYSNFSKVRKRDIVNNFINVNDEKNKNKILSIPLNDYAIYILNKYEYKLPRISNQKFNEYIKDVIQEVGFVQDSKKTTKIGKEITEVFVPFYTRVSSHTARRSFITIMKNKKIPDKIIMSYTGHKSLEVFNQYYKPNEDEKIEFMQTAWKMETVPLKKVN